MEGQRSGEAGYSLVEVIVAMTVFVIVSAAVMTFIIGSADAIRGNSDRVYAAAIARSTLDDLRAVGANGIEQGQTVETVTSQAGTFTVTTTARWEDVAVTDECTVGEGVVAGKSLMSVRIDVVGGDIGSPQSISGYVYPTDTEAEAGTGTVSVSVSDNEGAPVAGVIVSGSDSASGSFEAVTNNDGCAFVPDVLAGSGWAITVDRSGFITEYPGDAGQSGIVVDALGNTPVTFAMAQSGSVTFRAGSAGYPVPAGLGFTFQPDTWALVPATVDAYPATVTGLWPTVYTAWLLPCPTAAQASEVTVAVGPGAAATADLGGVRIDIVAPELSVVVAVFPDDTNLGACGATYALGTLDESLLLGVTLPAGRWRLEATGADPVSQVIVLDGTEGTCSVSWDVPGAVSATASPTPTPTPTQTGAATGPPEPTPSPTRTLPAVSEPCPTP